MVSKIMKSQQQKRYINASQVTVFPLPWSAYVHLLAIKDQHARTFYETEALRAGWPVRQLDWQINSQFYERITENVLFDVVLRVDLPRNG